MINEKKKILDKNKVTFNKRNLNTLDSLPYWQVDLYGMFLKRSPDSKRNFNNLTNLINSERILKSHILMWSLSVETKLKAKIENFICDLPVRNTKSGLKHDVFISKIYRKKTVPKSLKKALINAQVNFKNENVEQHAFLMKKFGYLSIKYYIKYLTFNNSIQLVKSLKSGLKEQIFNSLNMNDNFFVAYNFVREIRNKCAHDNSILDYQSKSLKMPYNIISSILHKDIHVSQYKDKIFNKNMIAIIISFKIVMTKPQYKKFLEGYEISINDIVGKLGSKNIIKYRLTGTTKYFFEKLYQMNTNKLREFDFLNRASISSLREWNYERTGNYIHFKNKDEAFEHILEMSYY